MLLVVVDDGSLGRGEADCPLEWGEWMYAVRRLVDVLIDGVARLVP